MADTARIVVLLCCAKLDRYIEALKYPGKPFLTSHTSLSGNFFGDATGHREVFNSRFAVRIFGSQIVLTGDVCGQPTTACTDRIAVGTLYSFSSSQVVWANTSVVPSLAVWHIESTCYHFLPVEILTVPLAASPMPSISQTPSLNSFSTQFLLQFGLDNGLSWDRCLAGTGLDWRELADPVFVVGVDQELQLIRNLAHALDHIPGAGLQAGLRYRLASRGVWGFALLSCATLRDAIRMAFRYKSLWNPLTTFHVEESGNQLVTTIDDSAVPDDLRAFMVDRDLGASVSFMRDLIGTTLPAVSVTLRRPAPTDVRPYQDIFGVTPVFGAEEIRVVRRSAGYLDRSLPGSNTELARQCEAQCEAMLARWVPQDGLAGQLRKRLVARPGSLPDMETVAKELHMSLRTLNRRLAGEGTSFRQLQEEVREALADELLAEGLKLEHVADTLGYGEVSNFIRAYRRWKGDTPHRYRERLSEGS
jgi:AraC-like DNA-binding protein